MDHELAMEDMKSKETALGGVRMQANIVSCIGVLEVTARMYTSLATPSPPPCMCMYESLFHALSYSFCAV